MNAPNEGTQQALMWQDARSRSSPGGSRRLLARTARGFTMIELLVALSCAAIILTATMTAVTYTIKESTRGRAERDLVREGEFVALILQRALERAGMGVPDGLHLDDGNPDPILAVVFAGTDAVGIVGDFPRPHAMYPTLGALHSRPGGDKTKIAYHTENNGTCVPNTAPPSCDIADASLFFPGDTTQFCNSATHFDHRTCAWGLRRLAAGDAIQIVSGVGGWTTGTVAGTMEVTGTTAFLKLTSAYADSGGLWLNAGPADSPSGIPGHNFVTTLDRVFFRYDVPNRRLERIQCWGPPNTAAPWWPPATAATLPATLHNTPAVQCTPWESLLSDVDAVAFSYFNAANGVPATKADISRVEYRIQLSKNISGQTVRYVITGSSPIWRGNV